MTDQLIDLFQPLTDGTRYVMTPWQVEDLKLLAEKQASANWSEMGAYKTSTGLWLLDHLCTMDKRETGDVPKALIITSKGGKGTYFDAIPKCIPKWRLYNLYVSDLVERVGDVEFQADRNDVFQDLRLGYFNDPTIVLAHYDCFTNKAGLKKSDPDGAPALWERLGKIDWTFILADEAHRMKNRDTQWTKNIKSFSPRAKYRHAMTGTGFVNNPAEIWSILDFLDHDGSSGVWPMGSRKAYWPFRTHFCEEVLTPQNFRVIVGIRKYRVDEFRALRKSVGPRRMMAEVHKDIGHPIESAREVELSRIQRTMYNEIKNALRTLDQAGEPITSPNVISMLSRLRQICVATPQVNDRQFNVNQGRTITDISLVEPSSKLDEVMDILSEVEWENGHKPQVVVFSCFRDPLELLANRLGTKDIPYLHMKQKHSDSERYHLWHDVFPRKEHKVFMSTLALGGESISLASAQYLIFLDRDWSPKNMMQGVGRVYRPGQKAIPEIIYINAKNTVDQYVKGKLDRKKKWFDEIFNS